MPGPEHSPLAASPHTLADWLSWLETLSPHEIELGLERVQRVLARLGLARPRRVLHVAGTNGKGSTCAMLEALYRSGGARVACYTSPHLVRYNERVRVDGVELADDALIRAFERVEAVRDGVPLTYFEFGTLAALAAFEHANADTWILEIGLGGRLDAVNAVEPDGGIITGIALDHCDWLGPDIESIAREKAGIMRRGKPLVFGSCDVPAAIRQVAQETGADLRLAGRDYRCSRDEGRWTFATDGLELTGLAPPALRGRFQYDNAGAALALYAALEPGDPLSVARVDAAFSGLVLGGRLQRLSGRSEWLLDVAHNPQAAASLAEVLPELAGGRTLHGVIGVLGDKDADGMLAPLLPLVSSWTAVTPDSPRAMPAVALAARIANLSGHPCHVARDIDDALARAEAQAGRDGLVLVTGSFYTVGLALPRLMPANAASR